MIQEKVDINITIVVFIINLFLMEINALVKTELSGP